jgi:putative transposase
MARPLRLEFAGALYHITSRGDHRDAIYMDDADRLGFLELLGDVCRQHNWRIHAYCLMSNHYHLLAETIEGNLSQGMRQLNGIYTQQFNRRHRRVGHVFQGRYKAILVEKESYLLTLARYIVLNPVRAIMVADVADWPWSSYAVMMGATSPPWLEVRLILADFASEINEARKQYRQFVLQGLQKSSPWNDLQGQVFLGSKAFVETMQAQLNIGQAKEPINLQEIPQAQRRAQPQPLCWFQENYPDRDTAIRHAWQSGGYSQLEIAKHFGLHYSSISRIVHQNQNVVQDQK